MNRKVTEFEFSFPISIFKDILEFKDDQNWRQYRASVSHANPALKTGSVRARVVCKEAGGKFVNLVFAFPRSALSIPKKGRYLFRVDGLQEDANSGELSADRKLAENSSQFDTVADDASGCQESGGFDFEISNKKTTRGRRPKSQSIQSPKLEIEPHVRPTRRREKPSRYKDFDIEAEDGHNAKTNTGNQDEAITTTTEIHTSDSDQGTGNGEMNTKYSDAGTEASLPKKTRNRYDKLIRNITQASQHDAESGVEIQSVLSTLKASFSTEVHIASEDLTATETCQPSSVQRINPPTVLVQSTPNKSAVKEMRTSAVQSTTSTQIAPVKIWTPIAPKQHATVKRVTHPHLTSFPRKFPSGLLSTPSPAKSLVIVTVGPSGSQQFKSSESAHKEAVERVMQTYLKIQPAKDMPQYLVVEEELDEDDNDDPDYTPSAEGTDEITRNVSRKRKGVGRLSSGSTGQSLQNVNASEVRVGIPFFIPQLKLVQGQTKSTGGSSVLVGPFHVVSCGAALSLEVVPQKDRGSMPPKVLCGDLNLPSGTVKGLSAASGRLVLKHMGKALYSQQMHHHGTTFPANQCPAIVDHDYTDVNKPVVAVDKPLKTLAKPISLAQHISARVEKVEEGEGKSLVTISGMNMKASNVPDSIYLTPKVNHEGMPVVGSLEEVMTDTLKRIEKYRESYKQALQAKPTAPVYVGVSDMSVAGEIVLTFDGQAHSNKVSASGRRRSRKQTSGGDADESENSALAYSISNSASHSGFVVDRTEEGLPNVAMVTSGSGVYLSQLSGENFNQGILGANFFPGELISLDVADHTGTSQVNLAECTESDLALEIENEAEMDPSLPPNDPKFCNYCLRLFPSSCMLYNHVKSVHTAYRDTVEYLDYLEALKRDSRILCPYCPGKQYLSNRYRYRTHLAHFHKDQMTGASSGDLHTEVLWYQCEICMLRFQSMSLLTLHMARKHKLHLLPCPSCQECFAHESSLDAHLKDVHGYLSTLMYQPSIHCGEEFLGKGQLTTHYQQLHGIKVEQEELEFSTVSQSDTQTQLEEKGPNFCQLCNKSFKNAFKLSRHLEMKHQDFEERGTSTPKGKSRIKCTCCLARFQSLGEMQEHKRHVHTGAIPVHCAFCGTGYQSTAPMYTHVKNHHLRTQALICTVCTKQFRSRQAFERHAQLFHHMRPSVLLEYSSPGARNVDMYKTAESDDVGVSCPFCSEMFTKETLLVVHIIEGHREQFPHECQRCEQNFLTEKALHHHLHGAHDEIITPGLSPPQSPSPLILNQSVVSTPFLPVLSDAGDHSEMANNSEIGDPSLKDSESNATLPDAVAMVFNNLPEEAKSHIRSMNSEGKRVMLVIDDGKGGVQQVYFDPSTDTETDINPLVHAATGTVNSTSGYVHKGIKFQVASPIYSQDSDRLASDSEESLVVGECMVASEISAVENLVYSMEMPAESGDNYQHAGIVEISDGQIMSGSEVEVGTESGEVVMEESVPMETEEDVSTVTVETSDVEAVTISAEDFLKLLKESHATSK